MKVCIPLRDPAKENLHADNLRSEPRWERLVLEACITNPEITEIYTMGYEWENGKFVTDKYRGILRNGSDCILLMQDWFSSVITSFNFKAAVVNLFAGPWLDQKEEVLSVTKKLNNNLFFVVGHPTMYTELLRQCGIDNVELKDVVQPKYFNHLQNFVTLDRFFLLPLPWIPQSYYTDRFNNKNLLWETRPLLVDFLVASKTIKWALKEMLKDQSLSLDILTGWSKEEVRDRVNDTIFDVKEDLNTYFWKYDQMSLYAPVRDRVHIHYGLGWDEVLAINSKSKLLISYGKQYGGAPMEAAMYGVPFVGSSKEVGALAYCDDYLVAKSEKEACDILGRLMYDHEYYKDISLSYNKYGIETYSFATFNRTLNNILESRGLL